MVKDPQGAGKESALTANVTDVRQPADSIGAQMIYLDGMQLHELLALRRRVDAAIANASPISPLTEEEQAAPLIQAIKSVRDRSCMTLLEARAYVEMHRKERYVPGQ